MPTLQFEHAIKHFSMWKAAFHRDPIDRRRLGVRRHRVYRPLDDPNGSFARNRYPPPG